MWVNLEMVASGHAWHYKQYSKDKQLAAAELKARKAKLGLWRDSSPVPPWEWRRRPKAKTKTSRPTVTTTTRKTTSKAGSGRTAYLTKTGSKYHRKGCRSLRKSSKRTTVRKARGEGYEACGICW